MKLAGAVAYYTPGSRIGQAPRCSAKNRFRKPPPEAGDFTVAKTYSGGKVERLSKEIDQEFLMTISDTTLSGFTQTLHTCPNATNPRVQCIQCNVHT